MEENLSYCTSCYLRDLFEHLCLSRSWTISLANQIVSFLIFTNVHKLTDNTLKKTGSENIASKILCNSFYTIIIYLAPSCSLLQTNSKPNLRWCWKAAHARQSVALVLCYLFISVFVLLCVVKSTSVWSLFRYAQYQFVYKFYNVFRPSP